MFLQQVLKKVLFLFHYHHFSITSRMHDVTTVCVLKNPKKGGCQNNLTTPLTNTLNLNQRVEKAQKAPSTRHCSQQTLTMCTHFTRARRHKPFFPSSERGISKTDTHHCKLLRLTHCSDAAGNCPTRRPFGAHMPLPD